ncbi:MAG: polysaccharide deacetylase family protein [bacterium]
MNNKIIFFHAIRDQIWFEKVIILLKSKYKLIKIKDLEDFYYSGKILKNVCHLTIDDGDKTFYNIMYPILKKHNVPATLFVSPKICTTNENFWFQEIKGDNEKQFKEIIAQYYNIKVAQINQYLIGMFLKNCRIEDIWNIIFTFNKQFNLQLKEPQNLSFEQLSEIDKEGLVTIGAHTLNHPILANEKDECSKNEIISSIMELENILEHEIKYFAYPNGIPSLDFGQREMDFLKYKNIRLAFSIDANNFTQNCNPLSIPRFELSHGNQLFLRAKLLLGNNWEKIKNIKSKGEYKSRIEIKNKLNLVK